MRIRCLLVAAALTACGGDETSPAPKRDAGHDSGADASEAVVERDAGHDAGHDSGKPSEPEGGRGGSAAGSGGTVPTGGMAAGGAGGSTGTGHPPESGSGEPMGGGAAPAEHVLWSQEWTVEVHSAIAYGAAEGDQMGLILDAGQGCRFGLEGAASGSTQTYETDGACITAFSNAVGAAGFFGGGMSKGTAGRMPLEGWKEAVAGHTVTSIRRTQTYTLQVLGVGDEAWAYADFYGKFEAIGK